MKSIDKTLSDYVKKHGQIISNDELLLWAKRDPNAAINTLFAISTEVVEDYTGEEKLDRLIKLLNFSLTIMLNIEGVNRKIVSRKVQRLYEKVERVKEEKKKKFKNIKQANIELDRIQKLLEDISNETVSRDTKKFDFIANLATEVKNLDIIDFTLKNYPSLSRAKDKKDRTLLHNMVIKYIESLKADSEEDIAYYRNLIALLLTKDDVIASEDERKKIVNELLSAIDQLSMNKKSFKKNSYKIDRLKTIIEVVKGTTKTKAKEVTLLAKNHAISINFDEKLIEQAKLSRESKTGKMTGREVIDEYIITIDEKKAQEIDDGLSCRKLPNGNYLLGVHIASVLGYFPYESEIIQEAIRRTRSIYLPRGCQPCDEINGPISLLPFEFSADVGSLLPGENKLARSYFFEIDSERNIVNERFVKSIVKSSRKSSYSEIDLVLKNGTSDERLQELVTNLQEVTNILDRKYKPSKLYERIKEYTRDYSDLKVKRVGAEKIVYQAMLLTGNRVAEYFASNNYPFIYRVHSVNKDNERKLSALVDNLTRTYGNEHFDRLYQLIEGGLYPKGWYATSGEHSGLKLKSYCHCTSGLRRAADILAEHAMEVCYDKEPTEEELEELREELEEKISEINAKENQIDWFVKDCSKTYQKKR